MQVQMGKGHCFHSSDRSFSFVPASSIARPSTAATRYSSASHSSPADSVRCGARKSRNMGTPRASAIKYIQYCPVAAQERKPAPYTHTTPTSHAHQSCLKWPEITLPSPSGAICPQYTGERPTHLLFPRPVLRDSRLCPAPTERYAQEPPP